MTENPIPTAIRRSSTLRKILLAAGLALAAFTLLAGAVVVHSRPMPPPSPRKAEVKATTDETDKARRLFQLARAEHRRLQWDACLARRAFARARQIVDSGVFEHEDPKTGVNPAWKLVARCYQCRYAGENLSKGNGTAVKIHEALMASPRHRKNIRDPRFDRMGTGCFDNVCVELFAGF